MKKYIFVTNGWKKYSAIPIGQEHVFDSIKEVIFKDSDMIDGDKEHYEIFYGDYIDGCLYNFSSINRNEWLPIYHKLKTLR